VTPFNTDDQSRSEQFVDFKSMERSNTLIPFSNFETISDHGIAW
jgi:hypothetical protein